MRPAGVTVLAILCFLVAAYEVLSGIRLLARGGFVAAFFSGQYRGSNFGAASGLPELGAGLIFLVIVFPALYALAGLGLWKVKSRGAHLHPLSASNRLCF